MGLDTEQLRALARDSADEGMTGLAVKWLAAADEIDALRELVAAQDSYMAMQRVGIPNERVLKRLESARAALLGGS